jgi:hypothetical protein
MSTMNVLKALVDNHADSSREHKLVILSSSEDTGMGSGKGSSRYMRAAVDSGGGTGVGTGTSTGMSGPTGGSSSDAGGGRSGVLSASVMVGAGSLRATQLTTGTPIKALDFQLPLVPPQWNESTTVFEEGGVGLFLTPSATIGTVSAARSFLGEVKGQKYQQVYKGLAIRNKSRAAAGGLVQVSATINVAFSCPASTGTGTGTGSGGGTGTEGTMPAAQQAGTVKAQLVFIPNSLLGASISSDKVSTQLGTQVVAGLQATNDSNTIFTTSPVMFLTNEPGQFQVRLALASFESPTSMDQMSKCIATLLPNSSMTIQHWV